jgi:predicted ATPase
MAILRAKYCLLASNHSLMSFIKSISFRFKEAPPASYPFHLPFLPQVEGLRLGTGATILVGDNGCGKSTVLEALACGLELPGLGGPDPAPDPTLAGGRALAQHLVVNWLKRTRQGFFFRAEDFAKLTERVARQKAGIDEELQHFENQNYGPAELAKVRGMLQGQRREITRRYGEELTAFSHGEAFLQIFKARFTQPGVYVLDEPEASLSPVRQLALLGLIHQMIVRKQAQFVLATHSPILMGLPGAQLYQLGAGIEPVAYQDTEHYQITKGFLTDPGLYLRQLNEGF